MCCFCTQYWDPSPILINATLCWMSVFFDFPSFNSPSINDALELDTLTKHNNCLATCTPQLTTIIQQLYTFDGILPDHLYRSTSYYLLIKWVDCMKLHCNICFAFTQMVYLVIFFSIWTGFYPDFNLILKWAFCDLTNMYLSPTIIILLKYPLIYEVQGQEADRRRAASVETDLLLWCHGWQITWSLACLEK